MTTSTSCPWCHELVSVARSTCPRCGHEAHVPRVQCECLRCRPDLNGAADLAIRNGTDDGEAD